MDRTSTVVTPARVAGFHSLRVAGVEKLTDDTVAIGLVVPADLAATFSHRAGQHLTIRHVFDGREVRRSYSICTPPVPAPARVGNLRIVVKRLGNGGFAEYATTCLVAGESLEVGPPTGAFLLAERPGAHHVLFAGGSGITPLLSMAVAALSKDSECRVSLICANQTSMSVLLADELADLKDAYVDRFFLLHVLSQEEREVELLSGRIGAERLPLLLASLGAEPGDDCPEFYLCGPQGLIEAVRAGLTQWGADPSLVHFELFSTGRPGDRDRSREVKLRGARAAGLERPGARGRFTARLGGRTTVVAMEPGDEAMLDAVLRARPETPYSCRDGLCGTCRAKVIGGSVQMDQQYALGPEELQQGYTLTCRAQPATEGVELDFDV